MSGHLDRIRSAYTGMAWPAIPPANGAFALALQFQLERSQWQAPETLRSAQLRQLGVLLKHAHATVPFYRERLAGWRPGEPVTAGAFASLPVLTRRDVQAAGAALHSTGVPSVHAPVGRGQTSGATGTPIVFLSTPVTDAFWRAFNLRNQLWHRRDLGLKLAAIRPDRGARDEHGIELPTWGVATAEAFQDGPSALLHSTNTLDRQLEWLAARNPAYLLTFASNLVELAREMHRRGMRLPALREAITYGDMLGPERRAECVKLLGVKVVDMYTTQEAGYVALQCPDHDWYHVQSEGVIVEILDEAGRPCPAGGIGRVVITTLHNLAMPLVRYDIGDYAEAGPPCPCGRGLPVLRRILGRERNLAMTPDGRKFLPSFTSDKWMNIAPIRQLQLAQKARTEIEVRVEAARPLLPEEEQALAAAFRETLGYSYTMTVVRMERIPRSAGGKYEDFIREPGVS